MPVGELPWNDGSIEPNNTALTYLILNSNIHFTEPQVYKTLNLSPDNPSHTSVYQQLLQIVQSAAKSLYNNTHIEDLRGYPLSNIQYLSFMIADIYPEMFYCPVWIREELECDNSESVLVRKKTIDTVSWILKRCRYNEMWIITYLLKQEFNKVVGTD
ncbi:hypothetical protein Cantr_02696 [Candida viswanathii]|uniref:Uncharacterized protein n=1 Tax=Candida viswanathii TaxID=5486 RepID=A0A367YNP9_9ASCO|nr:hypothetical protein Cantr_02696 [Candida viswanathii]